MTASTAVGRDRAAPKYKAKFGENTEIDFSLRWLHEVEVENRMMGAVLLFDLSGKF